MDILCSIKEVAVDYKLFSKVSDTKQTKKLSPFMCFIKEKKDEVKSSNPGMSFKNILLLLGSMWKSMDIGSKNIYEKAAN